MKTEFKKYKLACQSLLAKKSFLIALVIVAVLGYGFAITHTSIGIDDTSFLRYYEQGLDIKLGRFLPVLIYKIPKMLQFNPMWLDSMGVLFLVLATLILCIFIKKISEDQLPYLFYLFLGGLFLSYPIINEIFIYMTTSLILGLGYLLLVLSIIFAYETIHCRKKRLLPFLITIGCLGGAISIYESFAQAFLVLFLLTMYVEIYVSKNQITWKETIKTFISYMIILFITVVLGEMLVHGYWLIRKIDTASAKNIAANTIYWLEPTTLSAKINFFLTSMKQNYIEPIGNYVPITIFAISLIVGLLGTILAKNKNKLQLFIIFFASFLANFALSVLMGIAAPHRTLQSVSLFIAFYFAFSYVTLNKKILKIIAASCLCYLVLFQTSELNSWFYNDYIRYEEERRIVAQVAYELEKNYSHLPVVFTGNVELSSRIKMNQTNGSSIINWGLVAFAEDASELYNFFKLEGFDIPKATAEQYQEGKAKSENLPKWPSQGSIVQERDYIIVHF